MATRDRLAAAQRRLLAFQSDPTLQRFVIPNVHPTGREPLGTGAYGSVEELEIRFAAAEGECGGTDASGEELTDANEERTHGTLPNEGSQITHEGEDTYDSENGGAEVLPIRGGLICAGKKIHDVLLESVNAGVDNLVEKYRQECLLMSDLRHPNVVQFLGVCFFPESSSLPILLMELLETSLHDLLEASGRDQAGCIPLALKRSLLSDIARGLVYLHNRNPPVIHR